MSKSSWIRASAMLGMALLAGAGGGCSFFASAVEDVTIRTKPANAVVIVNGSRYTGTPVTLPLSCKSPILIEAYVTDKDGLPRSLRRNYVVRQTLSVCGVLDTLGTIWLIPSLGLTTGGAYTFREHDIVIDLDPRETNLTYVPEEKLGDL